MTTQPVDRPVVNRAVMIYVKPGSNSLTFTRPDDAEEVYLVDWEDAGIRIPWSKGVSVKAALLAWARSELEEMKAGVR